MREEGWEGSNKQSHQKGEGEGQGRRMEEWRKGVYNQREGGRRKEAIKEGGRGKDGIKGRRRL